MPQDLISSAMTNAPVQPSRPCFSLIWNTSPGCAGRCSVTNAPFCLLALPHFDSINADIRVGLDTDADLPAPHFHDNQFCDDLPIFAGDQSVVRPPCQD